MMETCSRVKCKGSPQERAPGCVNGQEGRPRDRKRRKKGRWAAHTVRTMASEVKQRQERARKRRLALEMAQIDERRTEAKKMK